jgi:hypothetical protein
MSAHKRATVSIPEEEYRRLHDLEMKEQLLPKPNPFEARKAVAVLEESFHQLQQRQGDFQQVTASFSSQLQQFETEASTALIEQSAIFMEHLDDTAADLAVSTDAALQQQSQHITELNQQRERDFQSLSSEIEHLASDEERKADLAMGWLLSAADLLNFIDQSYPHQQLAPERLSQLENALQLAGDHLDQRMPEAAFLAARQTYTSLSELRLQLEDEFCRWHALHQSSRLQLDQLIEAAENHRFTHALDLDGQPLDFSLDVDFWSHRKLARFFQSLAHIQAQLDEEPFTLDSQTLQTLLSETLPSLRNQLQEIIFQARLNGLNSQVRLNIADIVIQALGSQGFALQDSEYANGDMRRQVSARLVNLEGSEVLVEVDPIAGSTPTSDLQLHSFDDGLRTEHELRQRSAEVARALRRFGLQVGPLSTPEPAAGPTIPLPGTVQQHQRSYSQIPS